MNYGLLQNEIRVFRMIAWRCLKKTICQLAAISLIVDIACNYTDAGCLLQTVQNAGKTGRTGTGGYQQSGFQTAQSYSPLPNTHSMPEPASD